MLCYAIREVALVPEVRSEAVGGGDALKICGVAAVMPLSLAPPLIEGHPDGNSRRSVNAIYGN